MRVYCLRFTVYSLQENSMTNRRNYVLVFLCQKNPTEEQKEQNFERTQACFYVKKIVLSSLNPLNIFEGETGDVLP